MGETARLFGLLISYEKGSVYLKLDFAEELILALLLPFIYLA